MGADQLASGSELDEVVSLSVPVALTLVRWLVVHVLPRIVGDVGNPVGKPGQSLRDAGAVAQILPGLLGLLEGDHGLADCLGLFALARGRSVTPAAADSERGEQES